MGPENPDTLVPPKHNPAEAVRVLLLSEEVFGTTLVILAIDNWGTECLQWHPGTLRMEFHDKYGIELPQANFDKLMAAISVLTSDEFFTDPAAFVKLANALSGGGSGPEFDPADALECAWAVTEALLLDPPEDNNPEPFSDDVRAYIAHTLKEDGFVKPPDVLRIALGSDQPDMAVAEYADDPLLFGAVYKVQTDKSAEIETTLREGLLELVNQLKSLSLRHGKTAWLEEKARGLLRASAETPVPS